MDKPQIMIKLSPVIDISFGCPICKNVIDPSNWLIVGMHTLCNGNCTSCGGEFYMEMPVNSGLFYPGILNAETGKRCDDIPLNNWYLSGLETAFSKRISKEVEISVDRKIEVGKKKVCILNTIDATYGHALYQLFNASYYLAQPDLHLIVLVQKDIRWLVPEDVPEIWEVAVSFSEANQWNDWLAEKIKTLIFHFSEVYICRSFVQADSDDFDIKEYSKITPFPLDEWDERLTSPTVTFIWRTDRFWRRILPKIIDNRITQKLAPSLLNKIRKRAQFNWILRFSRKLRAEIPGVDFAISGMDDRTFELPVWIKDYRYEKHSDVTAIEQCKRYAASHLVLGCNGSSLLLPGCHSGAVINIVPGDQWSVSAGTFAFRVTSIGDTHFRYTMVPPEVTINRLINILSSVLRDRSYILLQTSAPWRDHNANLGLFDWKQFRIKAYSLKKHFMSSSGLVSVDRKNEN